MQNEERILEIGNSILNRIKKESNENILEPAIAKIELRNNDNRIFTYWVVRNLPQTTQYVRDILGNIVDMYSYQKAILKLDDNSRVISRNAPLSSALIQTRRGKINFNNIDYEITTFAEYIPDLRQKDAKDGTIETEDKIAFNSLLAWINEYQRLKTEEENIKLEIEKREIENKERLEKELSDNKTKQAKAKARIEKYLADFIEFRDRPILDEFQEDLKTKSFLKGTLIIEGAPGTGKTVALVQRIKMLLDENLEDYNKLKDYKKEKKFEDIILSIEDKKLLTDKNQNWIFISPNSLLLLYLQNTLIKEKLDAHNQKIKTWDNLLLSLMQKFSLIGENSKGRFERSNLKQHIFLSNLNLKILLEKFENYFIQQKKIFLNKIIENKEFIENFIIDFVRLRYTNFPKNFKNIFGINKLNKNEIDNLKTYSDIFAFYNSFTNQEPIVFYDIKIEYNKLFEDLNNFYKAEQNKLVSNILFEILKDTATTKIFLDYIKNKKDSDIDEEDEDEEITENELIENSLANFNLSIETKSEIAKIIEAIIKKIALQKFHNVKYNKIGNELEEIFQIIKNYVEKKDIKKISDYLYFKKYDKIFNGLEINIFNDFFSIYKNFRKLKIFKSFLQDDNFNYVQFFKNKKLSAEEAEFILFHIFKFNKILFDKHINIYNNSNHFFVNTFRQTTVTVIGVDECTDFSTLQLLCMTYLAHPKFNCITLAGDLMQRLKITGISDWKQYEEIVEKNIFKGYLQKVYRQTPNLMKIATKLCELNNQPVNFEYHINENKLEEKDFKIKPLLKIEEDIEKQLKWVVERVKEIFNIYGNNMLSSAVIVKNETLVREISEKLNKTDLTNFSEAEPCYEGRILGEINKLRVFSIDYVKGLEFQTVFLLNIDDYEDELLFERIYVATTRANLFLAITAKTEIPKKIKEIEQYFDKKGNWKKID